MFTDYNSPFRLSEYESYSKPVRRTIRFMTSPVFPLSVGETVVLTRYGMEHTGVITCIIPPSEHFSKFYITDTTGKQFVVYSLLNGNCAERGHSIKRLPFDFCI